jgi:type VI secretion system protein VasD
MRLPRSVIAVIASLALCACAGSDPQSANDSVKLNLTVAASPDVNPDDQKRAAPIVVRLYELKTDAAFNTADFFSLQDKDKTLLAEDLVARDQFQLRPGEHRNIARKADRATTTLGILAAYRDLPNAVWRTVYPLPVAPDTPWYRRSPKLSLNLNVDLDANAIRITEKK